MKKLIVADASPLIGLAKINCLDLLFVSFSEIHIPGAVFREVTVERHREDSQRIHEFVHHHKQVILHKDEYGTAYQKFRNILDEGESQALALAKKLACGVLLDERSGRKVAKQHQIPVAGMMGILLTAKRHGKIAAIKPLIEGLQENNYRLSDDVIQLVLGKANE